MRKRDDSCGHGVGGWNLPVWDVSDSQKSGTIHCGSKRREMEFRTESQFSTELPFTRGSFTASVRDHNLREASHLYYEGKEY